MEHQTVSDRYQQLTQSPPGRFLTKRLGLPEPAPLRRYESGAPVADGPVLLGGEGRLLGPAAAVLQSVGAPTFVPPSSNGASDLASGAGLATTTWTDDGRKLAALVLDASGIEDPT